MTWKEAKREMMFAKRNVLEGSYIDQAYDKAIEALSQSERKKGRWIPVTNGRGGFECNQCHCYAPSYQDGVEWLSAFCPNCGCDMRGDEEWQ